MPGPPSQSTTPATHDSTHIQITETFLLPCWPTCCCCRYSPNLSKRTTHLVTPEVVGSVTEKLAAAAAGPGQQRFRALQVVSKCWVSASAGLRVRADETQFAAFLPPPGATANSSGVSAVIALGRLLLSVALEACLEAPDFQTHFVSAALYALKKQESKALSRPQQAATTPRPTRSACWQQQHATVNYCAECQ